MSNLRDNRGQKQGRNRLQHKINNSNDDQVEFAADKEINDADEVVKKLLERDNNPDRC